MCRSLDSELLFCWKVRENGHDSGIPLTWLDESIIVYHRPVLKHYVDSLLLGDLLTCFLPFTKVRNKK